MAIGDAGFTEIIGRLQLFLRHQDNISCAFQHDIVQHPIEYNLVCVRAAVATALMSSLLRTSFHSVSTSVRAVRRIAAICVSIGSPNTKSVADPTDDILKPQIP